ncbi:MAG: hypothetical protein K2L42_00555 [Clostridia bacterium]|nr:hypothetical protein [Clostridia bacterium]
MIDLILSIIKFSVFFLSSFYAFIRLNNYKLSPWDLFSVPASALFATGVHYATQSMRILIPLCIFLLVYVYNLIRYRKNPFGTLATSIISFGISIFIYIIALLLSAPLDFIIFQITNNEATRYLAAQITIDILQIIAIIIVFQIKRFKGGLSPHKNEGSYDFLLLISIVSIVLLSLFYMGENDQTTIQLILIFLVVCGLGLIFWWRKHERVNYQQIIIKQNTKILESRLQAYEEEKQQLLKNNAELAKIIHRDNKLIPAMVSAVDALIAKSDYKTELASLKAQLEEFSSQHGALVNEYSNLSDNLPKTGVISVDAVLHFIYSKAVKQKEECTVTAKDGAFPLLFASIPEQTDLNTVICDMAENALISAGKTQNGKVALSFAFAEDGSPRIEVYDNGAPFDKKVVANLGKRKITTRNAEGGSGVGLMTLFEILRRYGASFTLDENSAPAPYTKCVSVTFDKKGNTTVISRGEQITAPLPPSEDPAYK